MLSSTALGLELVTWYSKEITKAIYHTRECWFFFFALKELINNIVKSSVRTHSSEQDLSENDWIAKNLQSNLNILSVFFHCNSCIFLPIYLLTSCSVNLACVSNWGITVCCFLVLELGLTYTEHLSCCAPDILSVRIPSAPREKVCLFLAALCLTLIGNPSHEFSRTLSFPLLFLHWPLTTFLSF